MVCAMFRNLGHHLVVYYLPEEYDKIVQLADTQGLTLEAAVEKVLGISFPRLGTGIIQRWRLSPRISASMLSPNREGKPRNEDDKLRLVSAFSNELSEVVSSTPADEVKGAVDHLLQKYRKALHLSSAQVPKDFLSAVQTSFTTKYSTLLGVDPERSQFFRNAKRLKPATHDEAEAPPGPAAEKKVVLPDRAAPAGVLETALQGFVTDFGFRRALVLAPGTERSTLRVMAAWGEDAAMLKDELIMPVLPSMSDDFFSSAFHHGKDVVVLDAFDAKNSHASRESTTRWWARRSSCSTPAALEARSSFSSPNSDWSTRCPEPTVERRFRSYAFSLPTI